MNRHKKLYTRREINARVRETGKRIAADSEKGKPLLAVCVIKGAVIFFADLVRSIKGRDVRFAFVSASSYKTSGDRMVSSGGVDMKYCSATDEEINGADVLLVVDIVDTGRTIAAVKQYFVEKGAKRVRIAALLDKPDCRKVEIDPDYSALTVKGNPYIIGYGLDNAQKYRNLDGIFEQ